MAHISDFLIGRVFKFGVIVKPLFQACGRSFMTSPRTQNSQMGETCHYKYHMGLQHIWKFLVHLFQRKRLSAQLELTV